MGAKPARENAGQSDMRTATHPPRSRKPRRTRRARFAGAALVVAAAALAGTTTATADPPAFDSGVGLPAVGNFNPVTLNGTRQLTSASIAPFVVTDDSGSLAGWHVTLLVPDFNNGTGADCSVGSTATLAGANVSMNAPVVTAADVTTSMTGVTSSGYTDFTTPRTIIDAAAGDGAGTYDVAPALLQLVVPANTMTGNYCTQATIAITSGP